MFNLMACKQGPVVYIYDQALFSTK